MLLYSAPDWAERWLEQADDVSYSFGNDPLVGGWFHLLAFLGITWFLIVWETLVVVWED